MSFRVNTNLSAMNALRNLGNVNAEFSKSINRLSTGMRINSAADDPAGLIISEQFRSKIRGIDQAVRNSQDAINYAKTAEGAFDEVNRLLTDAKALAVGSANSATLSSAQLQANQSQLNSIVSSITRIAENTAFGSKKLLDGTSGVTSAVSNGTNIAALNIGGTFGGSALTSNATVTLSALTAATQAELDSQAFATTATAVSAGSFTINGVTFNTSASNTVSDVINMVNAASGQTGVTASYDGTGIHMVSNEWGSNGKITLTDASGVLLAAPGTASDAGSDAVATLAIGTTTGVLFTGSKNGTGGLTLTDADGNTLTLTELGNVTTAVAAAIGQVVVGSAQFQIGGGAGETASLSLSNYAASQLGTGAVSGKNLSNLDLSTASGASDALKVIEKAIEDVAKARGMIGNFQRNVLESNIRSLGVAKENLSASESMIRDADVAEEMTRYTKYQILQQAGMSVLSQANAMPQSVLSLLR